MRKSIGVLLFLLILLGFSEGSGARKTVTLEPQSFTFWKPLPNNMLARNNHEIFEALEQRTGVHIEFIHPPAGQETIQYNLMLAANDLTDFICDDNVRYPSSVDKAFAEGIYIPVEGLIEEYCPNLRAIYESNPQVLDQMKTVQGHIWGFGRLLLAQDNEITFSTGPAIRQDWLDELGLAMPVTLSEWHTVLTAFKAMGAEAPLILSKSGVSDGGEFLSAFGIAPNFYAKDGKVLYGPIESGYKNYLELMHGWYNEGLLDPNFASTAADYDGYYAYLIEGKSGAIDNVLPIMLSIYNKNNTEASVKPAPHPRLKSGDILHFNDSYEVARDSRSYITGKCDPEKLSTAAMWWDYLYSDEYFDLINEVRTAEGGAHAWGFSEGRTNLLALPKDEAEFVRGASKIWTGDTDGAYAMPECDIPAGYSDEFNALMTEIDAYREQMTLKFILGVEPIADFDKYLSTLERLNIARAIEIKQIAYDVYRDRISGAGAVYDKSR